MISGQLVFENAETITEDCEVKIIVEDTSRVGDTSTRVAEQTMKIKPSDLESGVAFSFDDVAPKSGLTIRAHLSKSGAADINLGDHITMGAFPADEDAGDVILREVK